MNVEKGPYLYEFFAKLQSNFKIMQVEEELRANIIKENLDGIARTIISESNEDEKEIIDILTENLGNENHILI